MSDLGTELDELTTEAEALITKLGQLKEDHFSGITRGNMPTYGDDTRAQIEALAQLFQKAGRDLGTIQKIVRGIKGPEPKLT